MMTNFDKEIISELQHEINAGKVNLFEDTTTFIELIEKNYPFVYSGIDWDSVDIISFLEIKDNMETKYKLIEDFLHAIILNFPDLKTEKVIVLGDYETNMAYEMKFSFFLKHYKIFIDLPQDTYVWFPISKRCINYTFEDEIYFG